jgi:hypothetical protein
MRKIFAASIMVVAIAAASCGTERESAAAASESPSSSVVRAEPESEPDSGELRSLESIPAPFWGRWTSENHSCTRLSNDVNLMYLEPGKVIFWNSFARVREVAASGNSRLFLSLEYHEPEDASEENPEGRSTVQLREMSLELASDESTLTAIESGRGVQVLRRCPSAAVADKARE